MLGQMASSRRLFTRPALGNAGLKRHEVDLTDPHQAPGPLSARIEAPQLPAGVYLVATPIGAARDVTLRALDVLNAADMLAAEDTRTLRHLMDIHGVPLRGRRIVAYHDHNADRARPEIMAAIHAGKSVAYCSDAGTPLVADPGFRLARDAASEGLAVLSVPGPSAVLAALSVAGLPSDRFIFAGFPPQPAGQRRTWLKDLAKVDATAIIFESPRRVKQTLGILCELDPDRRMVLCRELTKKFEEIIRGTAETLARDVPEEGVRGEVVLVLDRPTQKSPDAKDIKAMLVERLADMSVRDAASAVSEELGMPKREVYQLALSIEKDT